MATESGIFSVRVDVEKQKYLEAIAQNCDRSRSWVVNEAIDNYLELNAWQYEQITKAVELADGGGEFFSNEEIDNIVSKYK